MLPSLFRWPLPGSVQPCVGAHGRCSAVSADTSPTPWRLVRCTARRTAWSITWCAALLMAIPALTTAQPAAAPQATKPDPLDPKAAVPVLIYQSTFKPTMAPAGKPMSWREANDNVARIGGWRVYAREAQQPDAAAAPASAPAPMSAPVPAPPNTKPEPTPSTPAAPKPAPGHSGHKTP